MTFGVSRSSSTSSSCRCRETTRAQNGLAAPTGESGRKTAEIRCPGLSAPSGYAVVAGTCDGKSVGEMLVESSMSATHGLWYVCYIDVCYVHADK